MNDEYSKCCGLKLTALSTLLLLMQRKHGLPHRDEPTGFPVPAPFPKDKNDSTKDRANVDEIKPLTKHIVELVPERFTNADMKAWRAFWAAYPRKVEDVPRERLHPVTADIIPRCSLILPDSQRAAELMASLHIANPAIRNIRILQHERKELLLALQTRYAESISYRNPVSGHAYHKQDVRMGRAAFLEAPILKKGARICCLPPEDILKNGAVGERVRFWVGEIVEDEKVETDEQGVCLRPSLATVTFNVHWYGMFEPIKKGKSGASSLTDVAVRLTNSVTGMWKPLCGYKRNARCNPHVWSTLPMGSYCACPYERCNFSKIVVLSANNAAGDMQAQPALQVGRQGGAREHPPLRRRVFRKRPHQVETDE
eukprot:3196610-Pleurochrysis_carterae.AAC.1